ncbi:MAG: hypothetical protein AB8F34_06190 [Akkermansiaceae bacterium]
MMLRHGLFVPLLVLCLISQGCSREAKAVTKTTKPKHELYLEWHNKCLEGKTKEIDAQIDQFEAQLEVDENDHLARAYLGSACALRAKASFWGPSKLKFLNRGKKLMDEAVNSAPGNPRVRMIRAIGYYKVPKRFGKRAISVSDFEKIIQAATKGTHGLEINERQAILYYASLAFEEEEHKDAAKVKKLCHQLAPDSKYGKLTTK